MSDWTGNGNSIFKTLAASNHTDKEREQNDFYATDPAAINLLVKKVELPKQILEPACGSGCLSVRLEELGHDVKSYDLVDRGFGDVCDFFAMTESPFDGNFAIVTNPPYKFAKEFCLHAIDIAPTGGLVCMFLKTTFAEGKGRFNDLFSIYPPIMVLQCVERVICAKNADFATRKKEGSAVAYAWWIWQKGFNGQTILDWIL
jgi:hypothetical protein